MQLIFTRPASAIACSLGSNGNALMTHVPHELAAEFPDHAEALQALRASDAHFDALCERHHHVNREIHRIEAGVEAASDDRLEALKKQRLAMTDEVAVALARLATEQDRGSLPLP